MKFIRRRAGAAERDGVNGEEEGAMAAELAERVEGADGRPVQHTQPYSNRLLVDPLTYYFPGR